MRKILLATVATLGVTLAMSGGAKAQPVKPVAPGTLVVHFNGYFQFELGNTGSSYNNITTPATATSPALTYKLNPVSTIGDFRVYPGFDAQTVNGLDYGVATDIRTGYSSAGVGQNGKITTTTTSTTTATTKAGKTTYTTASTSVTGGQSGLYVKRAYGYIGTPDYGFVRFGQTDSATTLLQSGVIEAFGDGGQWTLEGGQAIMFPSNAVPAGSNQFIYADQSAVYSTDKVVYITPVFAGFSGIVGYEPNSDGLKEGYNSCASATSTCAALSSSYVAGDIGTRRKNTFDFGGQYLNTIDGFKIKAGITYLNGQPVSYDGPPVTTGALVHGYDNLNVYQAGGQVTFAGLTLGANIKGGQLLDGYAFKPKGARNALAYILSGSYVIGPYVIGASYFNSQSAGTYTPSVEGKEARTLSEYGLAVGANYVVSPNLSLFTQYLYGHRHQLGNATTSVALPGGPGNSQGQSIALGATLKW